MAYEQLSLFPAEEMDKMKEWAEKDAWQKFVKATSKYTLSSDQPAPQPGKKKRRKTRSNER